MNIYLKERILIRKPIFFLCGSIYRNNLTDKRFIFKKYIEKKLNNNVHVLIIDDFISKERMEVNLDISLFEEIFASISFVTYIFIESFSSVAELGLFSNSKTNNNMVAIIPKGNNLINNKLGYFLKDIMLDNDVREFVVYDPKVQRFAYGTDYVDEHYYFYNNCLPIKIASNFDNKIESITDYTDLTISEYDVYKRKLLFYEFSLDEVKKICYVNEKTMFYLISGFIEKNFSQSEIIYHEITDSTVERIYSQLNNSINNSLYYYKNLFYDYEVNIINSNISTVDFIKYSIHFNKYFYQHLLNQNNPHEKSIVKFDDLFHINSNIFYKKANDIFEFSYHKFRETIRKKDYIYSFNIYNNKKVRKIITYKTDEQNKLKENHILINECLRKYMDDKKIVNNNSFAYKRNHNTLQCISCHKNSRVFLKIDISKFFESINPNIVFNNLINLMQNDISKYYNNKYEFIYFEKIIKKIISECCYKKTFPIGFITSPIISDLSMIYFDKQLNYQLLNIDKNFIYTRYADDILISLPKEFSKDNIYDIVENELNKLNLKINEKKVEFKKLITKGDYIKFLGLNIVYNGSENLITIGNKFIKSLAKDIVHNKNKTQYEIMKINGLKNYLKYNDKQGYERLLKIIKIYENIERR